MSAKIVPATKVLKSQRLSIALEKRCKSYKVQKIDHLLLTPAIQVGK